MAESNEIIDETTGEPLDEHLENSEDVVTHGHRVNRRDIIILVANTIITLLMLKYLPFEQKANAGLALLFFAGVLWLTEAVHVTITALLVPTLAVAFGLLDVKKSLQTFAEPTIFLFFGGFALATALHVQGIDRFIANRLLRMARGHFGLAAVMLFLATAGLSMWISNTATAAMMLPLALGILGTLDVEKERNTFVFLLLGVAFSASIGGLGTMVGSPPNAIVVGYLRNNGVEFGFLEWMKYGLPMMLVMLPIMIGALYFVFRPKLHHRVEIQEYRFKWTNPRLITIGIFVLTASCWIFSDTLRFYVADGKQFDAFVALSAAVLIGVTGVASWKQIQENTEWGVLFLFGGGLTLSAVLGDSGASTVLADLVKGGLNEASPFVVLLAVTTFIIALTELSSNTAAAALLVPLFGAVGHALGMPPHVLPLVIGIGASLAFMLPVATPPNAIVFGTGLIQQKEMVKAGFVLVILSIIVVTLFSRFLWM